MDLLVPTALGFGAIIPIILLLYFMRPKRQERVVGSTLLWKQALQDLQASRPWQRLHVTPLLLLQLLAALIIVLILARPAIFSSSPISGNTIIILQASASMQATDVAPSRFDSAKNTIENLIDTMGPDDHLSIISMARTPQVLIANSQDHAQLLSAVEHARVTNQDADLEQALSLADSLAAAESDSQILIIGDGHVQSVDQSIVEQFPVRYMPVGTDAANTAFLTLSSRIVQSKLTAFAQVANYSHKQRAIPVELYANDKLVGVQTITLGAESSGTVEWSALPTTTQLLHAHLIAQDALSADHDAWAIVGSSIQGNVLLVTKGNSFLEAALRLQPNVKLYETTPDKYTGSINYDLTVFDGYVPAHLPSGSVLFVNPPDGSYPFGTSGQVSSISHITAGSDPFDLLANVDLSSIHVIHISHVLKPALWAQTIINAPETPLLIAGENSNSRVAVFGFDLHDSDLPLQPAFPILISNITNWLLPSPVPDNQVVPGVPVSIQTWPGANRVTVTGPDQQATTVGPPFPVTPYTRTDAVGLYHVAQRVRNTTLNGAFTVNLFDPGQSRLAPAKTLPILHSNDVSVGGGLIPHQLREIWPWIAAFLLLILCVEWWLFSRNYHSQPISRPRRRGDSQQLAGGNLLRRSRSKNTLLTHLQDEVQERYMSARKQTLKMTKQVKKKLRKPEKGERRVNI